ncbi:glycosyltransferase family 2 protein [Flavihumibacter sp. ZG627]|uniref:glycosyltransferase family 2 protein n=1 Tax=Flavihumibacter sp. ZG627 TaxID=1463156 RepID=UPI0005801AB6|nr:glycosyltransferase family 2 protein [Flavihumibacter sp. ZG627]KIC91332.1 glycosyl transferase family 2 [Flavihumibacter sp. ZG627]
MQATLSIVILNWNGRKYLEKFLPSVLASGYPSFEVIVADNASSDDSVAFLQTAFPTVKVLQLPENYGFAKGYNEALKQVHSDYYILLNSDVEVEPGWLHPLMALIQSDDTIGACQPKILMYDNKASFEYAGAAGGWLDSLGYPFARGRVFDFCELDHGQYNDNAPVFWASGAALLVRAKLYHELGGLDEFFFAHQEEIDFCWRMQLAGYKVMVCPASVVYHVGGGTLPKGNEWKVFLNFRNNLVMLAKNLPLYQSIWKIPLRFLLDSISAWKSLFDGQGTYFKAILEAHIGFMGWLVFRHRKSVFPKSKKGALNGWYSGSVVWQHFVKGKKQFSEIVADKK